MKELLFSVAENDFIFQTFRSGGKGGQKQNKVNSGIRLIHKASGARGESRSERSQKQNKILAFSRLIKTNIFKNWMKIETSKRILGFDKAKRETDDAMKPCNLKIEVRENNKWVEE